MQKESRHRRVKDRPQLLSMPSFSPQLFVYEHPDVSSIPELLENISEGEEHYFFGLLIKATRRALVQIADLQHIPSLIRMDPTLFHAQRSDIDRRINRLLSQGRLTAEISVDELDYIKRDHTPELFARLAQEDNPQSRQMIFNKYANQ